MQYNIWQYTHGLQIDSYSTKEKKIQPMFNGGYPKTIKLLMEKLQHF